MFLFWMNTGWSCCSFFVVTFVIHMHHLHCSSNDTVFQIIMKFSFNSPFLWLYFHLLLPAHCYFEIREILHGVTNVLLWPMRNRKFKNNRYLWLIRNHMKLQIPSASGHFLKTPLPFETNEAILMQSLWEMNSFISAGGI